MGGVAPDIKSIMWFKLHCGVIYLESSKKTIWNLFSICFALDMSITLSTVSWEAKQIVNNSTVLETWANWYFEINNTHMTPLVETY